MPADRQCYPVPKEADGTRLDAFLAAVAPGLTRSAAQQLIAAGAVRCDGRPAAKSCRLAAGALVEVQFPEPQPVDIRPQNIPLAVVYEDAELLVLNKPKGMVVHPAPGNPDGTLVHALLWHCQGQLSGINGQLRPGIVHRLDKDTSGLLVAAKTNRAHLGLAAQLEGHHIARVYHAVCYGGFGQPEGCVDAPIARDPAQRKRMKAGVPGGREAVTHYRVLAQRGGFSHLECRLETGRTHQIRVHMAYIGHPLAGDAVYGPRRVITELQGQCLHAAHLSFTHPVSGQPMAFDAPLPPWFVAFLHKQGLDET